MRFNSADRARILAEAAACTGRGELAALCKREGIHRSQLVAWRAAQRPRHGLAETIQGLLQELDTNRERQGLSSWQLSHDAGIQPTSWAKWLSGEVVPRLDGFLRVAQALGFELRLVKARPSSKNKEER